MNDRAFLVAIDLTDEADEVLAAGRRLADKLDAKLTAVTVVRPLNMMYADVGMAPIGSYAVDLEREALQQAHERIEKLGAQYRIAAEDCKVLLGSPATEIRKAAEESGAEMIVIGTHGRHGLGLILGSTANSVLHGVPCDVLVVRVHPKD